MHADKPNMVTYTTFNISSHQQHCNGYLARSLLERKLFNDSPFARCPFSGNNKDRIHSHVPPTLKMAVQLFFQNIALVVIELILIKVNNAEVRGKFGSRCFATQLSPLATNVP